MRRVRWGIVSAAKIAREQVIPAIQHSRSGTVFAIASRDRERALATAERHAIPIVLDDYDALLAHPDIDAVYIATPNSSHVEWTMRALEAGKHVLCEKPIALRAGEIDTLIRERNRTGLQVMEGFMVAHHPQWHLVRRLIAEGIIGRLQMVEGSFTYRNHNAESIKNSLDLGGGALRDIGVYPIVTTRLATGLEPTDGAARFERDPVFGTDRLVVAQVRFPGFDLSFYCGTQAAARQHMVFQGELGWLRLDAPFNPGKYDQARVTLRLDGQTETKDWFFPTPNQYQLMIENFADAVHGGAELLFPLESSRGNQAVLDRLFAQEGAGRG